jgi:site-specific recombinase XerD
MAWLPCYLVDYFERLRDGLEPLFPECRVQNKGLLLHVYACLEQERGITSCDIKHLKTLIALADKCCIPSPRSPKELAEAEAYLTQVDSGIPLTDIQYALGWLFMLFSRYQVGEARALEKQQWLKTWRLVQAFPVTEYGFVTDYIGWLVRQGFSPRSVYDCVRELSRFKHWMDAQDRTSLKTITNFDVQAYLVECYPKHQTLSKKRVLSSLKPLFHYFKGIDGAFHVPDFTIKAFHPLGLSDAANSLEISRLWEGLEKNHFSAEASMMLVLVLGYGLSVKALPMLKIEDEEQGLLSYVEQRSSRQGGSDRAIQLDLASPWLSSLWTRYLQCRQAPDCHGYVFVSSYASRRGMPVSTAYCQRLIQGSVKLFLGYPVSVNRLERGAVKALALASSLPQFMRQTESLPLTPKTRLMIWLYRNGVE